MPTAGARRLAAHESRQRRLHIQAEFFHSAAVHVTQPLIQVSLVEIHRGDGGGAPILCCRQHLSVRVHDVRRVIVAGRTSWTLTERCWRRLAPSKTRFSWWRPATITRRTSWTLTEICWRQQRIGAPPPSPRLDLNKRYLDQWLGDMHGRRMKELRLDMKAPLPGFVSGEAPRACCGH